MAITIIGAGLSGSEAAWAAANLGVEVNLFEMRPSKMTPAHKTDKFAELVCSNSLGGESDANAKGLLQAEMLAAKSLIMQAAHQSRLPAGAALAVEREEFSKIITTKLKNHPNITIHEKEISEIPAGTVVLASGPLSSEAISESIKKLVGLEFLSFYDAA
ncbi:MAG TPA: methylenetetrahydrofolate--tRNA-(uracil(54)-C(5))-methyltransferase (FADH(2)-oxidizing) TrmFO, partial [Trueperaceae bacterium]|nr:methylenetetrahydrofolate--tRNA-(uracil(54)-C(5))-methyltransferase (FADH(2)-oxidizing) TrmFO [Trueperaceae bacterium]